MTGPQRRRRAATSSIKRSVVEADGPALPTLCLLQAARRLVGLTLPSRVQALQKARQHGLFLGLDSWKWLESRGGVAL